LNVLDIILKNPEISNFTKILSPGIVLFLGDGRTDMTQLIVAFRNFAKARESGPRLRGHEEKGIIHRNTLL